MLLFPGKLLQGPAVRQAIVEFCLAGSRFGGFHVQVAARGISILAVAGKPAFLLAWPGPDGR